MTGFAELNIAVIELGERAADWLLRDELGQAYSGLSDRAWPTGAGCYAKCIASLGPDNVPSRWRPTPDEHGMWTGMQRDA